jgi:uncharacterized protein YerC
MAGNATLVQMKVSAKLSPQIGKEILSVFFQVFADTKSKEEIEKLFKSFLCERELLSLAKKLTVAKYLKEGFSSEEIKKRLKISSAMIAQIRAQLTKDPGLRLALEKISLDDWAKSWEKKIKDLFRS